MDVAITLTGETAPTLRRPVRHRSAADLGAPAMPPQPRLHDDIPEFLDRRMRRPQ